MTCDLAHGGELNFSKVVMIKEINHLTFGVAVLGKNVHQRKFSQHQLCLLSPANGHLQKNGM